MNTICRILALVQFGVVIAGCGLFEDSLPPEQDGGVSETDAGRPRDGGVDDAGVLGGTCEMARTLSFGVAETGTRMASTVLPCLPPFDDLASGPIFRFSLEETTTVNVSLGDSPDEFVFAVLRSDCNLENALVACASGSPPDAPNGFTRIDDPVVFEELAPGEYYVVVGQFPSTDAGYLPDLEFTLSVNASP